MKWKLSTSRHTVSSWRELWSGEWSQQPRLRNPSLWAGPPQRPSPQFPQFWLGVKSQAPHLGQKIPPDRELRRRPVEKEYYIWEPYSARPPRGNESSRTRSRWTLSRTPGSRAIKGNAYRWSLGHICTIASSPRGAGCVRENQSGQWDVSQDANRSTCAWPNSLHINSNTSGWSLNSLGLMEFNVCSYIVDPRDVSCSQRQQLPLGSQEDLARQFASGRDRNHPW